jgi:hypothetical protein
LSPTSFTVGAAEFLADNAIVVPLIRVDSQGVFSADPTPYCAFFSLAAGIDA